MAQVMRNNEQNKITRFANKGAEISLLICLIPAALVDYELRGYKDNLEDIKSEVSSLSEAHHAFVSDYAECKRQLFSSRTECLSDALVVIERTNPNVSVHQIALDAKPYTDFKYPNATEIVIDGLILKRFRSN